VVLVATIAWCVCAAPASAGVTTYWPSVTNTACNGSTVGSIGSGVTKRRGNWGYNRVWSQVYVNGGSWSFGAFYAGGGWKVENYSQAGAWNRITSIDGGQQSDPFMTNNNGVTVSGSGCFYW
jgi:hypothetical protein